MMGFSISQLSKIIIGLCVVGLVFGAFVHYVVLFILLGTVAMLWLLLCLQKGYQAFQRANPRLLVEPLCVLVAISLLWLSPLRLTSVYFRFMSERADYEQVLTSLTQHNENCKKLGCIVESRDPLRVAFPWYGAADNWYGMCYDPTGLVRKANILKKDYSNEGNPDYQKAVWLYGGALRDVQPISGSWYFCHFT